MLLSLAIRQLFPWCSAANMQGSRTRQENPLYNLTFSSVAQRA